MKIIVIAVGKKHDPKLADALAHYEKMLGSSCALEWRLLDSKSTSSSSREHTKHAEGEAILQQLKPDDTVIVLDEHGTEISSPKLAIMLETYQLSAVKRLVFVIGGAFGLDQQVIQRAHFVWSLSKLVFPHQLVRLILAEQLYRATTITAGKQYHY